MKYINRAFTLIELLVVIAVIAILAVVVILTLNPAELLRQSRDASRLSDMATLNTALNLFVEDTGANMGSASTTYISIPDPTATSTAGDQCQGLGLPTLPAGDTYQCASSSTYRNTKGSGWIPLNFSTISAGSPLGSLPIDPINQTSSGYYYSYASNGTQFEVASILESQKDKTQYGASVQDPYYPEVLAQGSNLALSQLYNPQGLITYLPFDDGAGSTTKDASGNGSNGAWAGTPAGSSGYYSGGKVGKYAGYFNGTDNYVTTTWPSTLDASGTWSVSLWSDGLTGQPANAGIFAVGNGNNTFQYNTPFGTCLGWSAGGGNCFIFLNGQTNIPFDVGSWDMWTITRSSTLFAAYKNGALFSTVSTTTFTNASVLWLGQQGYTGNPADYFLGSMDDVRVYNRTLSAAEVAALYNAEH